MRIAIFDLDGTLAETAPDLIGALNELLAGDGHPPLDPQAHRLTAGLGGRALIRDGWRNAGRPLSEAGVDARFAAYLSHYRARIDRETRLFPGVAEALTRLAAAGWTLSVCTNKPEALARLLLRRLGVADQFASLIGADTLPVRKPDPLPLIEAARRAGGGLEHAVMVGDTVTDRDAARAAGAPVILTTFGYAPGGVEPLAPDAVIDHFDQIDAALEKVAPR